VNREIRSPDDWRIQVRRRWCARLAGTVFRGSQSEVRMVTNIHGRLERNLVVNEIGLRPTNGLDHIPPPLPGK
jgi:hypothetical protein